MASKPKLGVGIDIGGFSIKLVELTFDKQDKPTLTNVGTCQLKGEGQSSVRDGLKELLNAAKISTNEVNISLSGPSVVVRYIQIPKMTDEELKGAIRFEAEKYIPFNINDVILDFQSLASSQEDAKKMCVLLVAAKKDLVESKIALLQEVGLAPKIIDIDSFCVVNSFIFSNPGIDKNKDTAILDIGSVFSEINIIRGNEPHFTRSIQIAGRDITSTISENLKLDIKSASEVKHNLQEGQDDVFEHMKPILFELVSEIRLSFSYYENQFGSAVDQVYITGGSAKLSRLPEFLTENLGVKTQRWDPLGPIMMGPNVKREVIENMRDQLATSVGLALRG